MGIMITSFNMCKCGETVKSYSWANKYSLHLKEKLDKAYHLPKIEEWRRFAHCKKEILI